MDRSKTCPKCGTVFQPKDWRNTFCSRRCSKLQELPVKTCARCGKVFRKNGDYSYATWERIRYCSKKCRGNGKGGERAVIPCLTCGATFTKLSRLHRYCSQGCAGIARRTAAFPDKRRGACFTNSVKAKLLLAAGHRCRCGATEDLECDHVVPIFLGGPNTIENGQVLCRPCHRAKTNAELRAAWAAA